MEPKLKVFIFYVFHSSSFQTSIIQTKLFFLHLEKLALSTSIFTKLISPTQETKFESEKFLKKKTQQQHI